MLSEDTARIDRIDLIRIANYYYKAGMTQEQIAKSMNMSRQRVNRLLARCIDQGIVTISIEGLEGTNLAIEAELEKKFRLKAVRVAAISSEENAYRELGEVSAQYLESIVASGDVIGFSRGRNVSALVDMMPRHRIGGLTVTQLMGGRNDDQSKASVDDIVHRFCEKTGSTPTLLYAPVLVNNPSLRKAIMEEPFFKDAYTVIRSCTIAVVGIGDAARDHGYIGEGDLVGNRASEARPVGEICTHYYDIEGSSIRSDLSDRVIAVTYDDYMRIPTRIGVAGLPSKRNAIIGAIRGGFINALVTDIGTAEALAAL